MTAKKTAAKTTGTRTPRPPAKKTTTKVAAPVPPPKAHQFTLTRQEDEVYRLTTQIIGEGQYGIADASIHALAALPNPRPEFVVWLSGGTVFHTPSGYLKTDELDFAPVRP